MQHYFTVVRGYFLPYLNFWEKSVSEREGYDASQKKKMLLSEETLVGIRRTGITKIIIIITALLGHSD